VAEYSFTGMATSPKETVRDAIDLAAMKLPSRCNQQVPAPLPAAWG
jgi:ribosomal protein L16/L10AE